MNTSPPYVRLLIATILVLFSSILFNEEDKREDFSVLDYADKKVKEGYVISIGFGKILISDKQVKIWQMVKGYVTSDYGQPYVIVKKHEMAKNENLLKGVKLNQRVRIYVDSVMESNPGRTYAYHIEVIEDE
ncbi:DUF3221 domain-containing protein [Bacillaceae bacterium CLA-AA-H227]|uniref:DUF3221 domain-containing protein n=1 Tax=Robertmurraya yapensis (ex Hitch et al 2024) TaxID=3133160 RepID=A0ACC6S6F1_9BACI